MVRVLQHLMMNFVSRIFLKPPISIIFLIIVVLNIQMILVALTVVIGNVRSFTTARTLRALSLMMVSRTPAPTSAGVDSRPLSSFEKIK